MNKNNLKIEYTTNYLLSDTITYNKWLNYVEKCFNTDCIDYIDVVINSKIKFNNDIYVKQIEKKEYQKKFIELLLYRNNLINKIEKSKRKIQKLS